MKKKKPTGKIIDSPAVEPSKEIVIPPAASIQQGGVDALLSQAVAAGASIDTLERLMDLRRQMLAEEAEKAFNIAMAAFQAACPVIKKTKEVKTDAGKVAYRYAPIESAVIQVKDLLQEHGFRYTTTMELKDGNVKAFCRVVHTLGHEEISEMEVPLGTKTNIMSSSQVVAAASTFAKRYAFLNAFGIMTGDEDNDTAPQRGDAPKTEWAKQPEKMVEAKAIHTVAKDQQTKKERPPRGVPYYDPKEDDGASMTPKQRAFMTKRWGEYMDKCGIKDDLVRAEALKKIITWSFERFGLATPPDANTLTVSQASYMIDHIPTLPIKPQGKHADSIVVSEVAHAAPLPTPPVTPPKPKDLTPEEISSLHEALKESPGLNELEQTWLTVIEHKKNERLGKSYFNLHQTYMRMRISLKKPL